MFKQKIGYIKLEVQYYLLKSITSATLRTYSFESFRTLGIAGLLKSFFNVVDLTSFSYDSGEGRAGLYSDSYL